MGLKTSELSFDERVKNAKKDKFMRASVAKAQDAQFEQPGEPWFRRAEQIFEAPPQMSWTFDGGMIK